MVPDGKVLVGSADTTFAGTGLLVLPGHPSIRDGLKLLSDGDILFCGGDIARVSPSGVLRPDFGFDSIGRLDPDGRYGYIDSLCRVTAGRRRRR